MSIKDRDILEFRGIKYYAPDRKDSIYVTMIKNNDIFEPHIIEQLCQGITKGSCVVDGGGHIGNHSMQFAKYAKKVFTFEPDAQNYNRLNINLKINKIDNVYVFPIALSDKRARYNYNPAKDGKRAKNTGANFLVEDPSGPIYSNTLDYVLKMDDLFDDNDVISMMKFDVEEMEYEALIGAASLINKFKPMLYVEMIREKKRMRRNMREVKDLLERWGYKSIDKKREIWRNV